MEDKQILFEREKKGRMQSGRRTATPASVLIFFACYVALETTIVSIDVLGQPIDSASFSTVSVISALRGEAPRNRYKVFSTFLPSTGSGEDAADASETRHRSIASSSPLPAIASLSRALSQSAASISSLDRSLPSRQTLCSVG